jgi:hypothetical protein
VGQQFVVQEQVTGNCRRCDRASAAGSGNWTPKVVCRKVANFLTLLAFFDLMIDSLIKNRFMANGKIKIENEKDYNATIKKIDALMKKEENSLTRKEAGELWILAVATYDYEEKYYYNSATNQWEIPQYKKV